MKNQEGAGGWVVRGRLWGENRLWAGESLLGRVRHRVSEDRGAGEQAVEGHRQSAWRDAGNANEGIAMFSMSAPWPIALFELCGIVGRGGRGASSKNGIAAPAGRSVACVGSGASRMQAASAHGTRVVSSSAVEPSTPLAARRARTRTASRCRRRADPQCPRCLCLATGARPCQHGRARRGQGG